MSKNNNMKRISIILGVLVILLLVLKIKDKKQGDRSFKSEIVAVNPDDVKDITIVPKGLGDEINLSLENENWFMVVNGKKVQAEENTIQEALNQFTSLKPKRVASTSKDKWEEYELTDSLAVRVIINKDKNSLADIMIGKFSYSQQTRQMTSYVRNTNEDEVYAVDGYLSMMLNRASESFRDNGIVIGEPEQWNKLVFTYPADSSFTLEKLNNVWMVNGLMADSVKVQDYFSKIRMLTDNSFADDTELVPGAAAKYQLRIEGDNFTPIEVKSYEIGSNLVTTSSINMGNKFNTDKALNVLYTNKESLIKN